MRNELIKNVQIRKRRSKRVRQRMHGTSSKPRICVFKSNKHIQVQLIDDDSGRTLGMAATFDKDFRGTEFAKKNKASASKIGEIIADIAIKQHNISEVIFDRGPFKYHGLLAALADSARSAGLKF